MSRGKKYKQFFKGIERGKKYSVEEAIRIIKGNKIAKFDESVEVHVKLSIDTKKGEQQVRGTVILPYGTGKTKKVAVITSTKAKEAKDAGADIIGGEEMMGKIKNNKIQFDTLVATPEIMPKLAQVAKILGPRGLMPSPKTETVTEKVKETVGMLKKGKVSFKNDDSSNIHQIVGKVSFDENKLVENIKSFLEALNKVKPQTTKGKFIINASLCSTMGPGIRISL
jgi:large subunit ribosomal protein L1